MSTQDDFVPKQYMKWVKDTQDNVPSEFEGTAAREYVTKKLREELGLEFNDVFESWDDTPLGTEAYSPE
jgi:predicted unusual protein kinase regulating ubiquinone biosynthesis (AarF/ABC1/UbiB family)